MDLLFVAALVVQLGCWIALGVGLRRAFHTLPETTSPETNPPPNRTPISVVVAARNEERRLPPLLDALAAQSHPDFEVVIVDDGSEDDTAAIVEARAATDERFRLVRVPTDSNDGPNLNSDDDAEPSLPRKKRALTLGIAAARHERLAFTDADCVPPPHWLGTLAAYTTADPDAVLVGYGPLRKRPGSLNAFVRYETLVTAVLTAATVGLGRPYMAVGRNFSYPRSVFDRVGGFAHSAQSLSGDDDLLVQEARRHGIPVRYVADERAFVPSEAPATWRRWARQKLRHTSAGRYYDRGAQLALAIFHGSNLLVWLAPAFLGWTGAGFLAARFLVQRAVLRTAMETLGERDLTLTQPLLDTGYALYNTLLAPLGTLWKPTRW